MENNNIQEKLKNDIEDESKKDEIVFEEVPKYKISDDSDEEDINEEKNKRSGGKGKHF